MLLRKTAVLLPGRAVLPRRKNIMLLGTRNYVAKGKDNVARDNGQCCMVKDCLGVGSVARSGHSC